jgi:hypothetical protein
MQSPDKGREYKILFCKQQLYSDKLLVQRNAERIKFDMSLQYIECYCSHTVQYRNVQIQFTSRWSILIKYFFFNWTELFFFYGASKEGGVSIMKTVNFQCKLGIPIYFNIKNIHLKYSITLDGEKNKYLQCKLLQPWRQPEINQKYFTHVFDIFSE